MLEAEGKHERIRQSVRVDCPIEDAFRFFTEGFGEWWPLASYSMTGNEAENCVMEPWVGGRVFERTRSGEELEWGSVIAWDPPEHLEFTWHPGGPSDHSQTVDVEFRVEADGTRVTLIHTGWDAPGIPACALPAAYTAQWSSILQFCFSEFISKQMLVEKDISLYINSPGGVTTSGLAILDTMNLVEPDIVTYCVGQAASMAAVLLAAGTKGKRYSLPYSRILIHQPHATGLGGQAADIDIQARDILRTRELLNRILADATGQPLEKIERDVDRDYILDSRQAVEYGMIDRVISKRELPGNASVHNGKPLNGAGH